MNTLGFWHVKHTSNQTNFKEISRQFPGDILTKLLTPEIASSLFNRWTLPNFSWQLLGSDDNPWDQWSCLPNKRNHHTKYTIIITTFQTTGLELIFLWLDAFVFIPSAKNYQEGQLNCSRLPVFPGGVKNSRRFPVFPGVVDTLVSFCSLQCWLVGRNVIWPVKRPVPHLFWNTWLKKTAW